MAYWDDASGRHADLWSAWTDRESPTSGPYAVLTEYNTFNPPPPPGGGDAGSYYSVQAGQATPSPYCRTRDGVLHYSGKSVDFARDSLVYELPYLDPMYDYFVRVSSYREKGNGWTAALSMNGRVLRNHSFAPNCVDTVWIKIPYGLYKQDRKVTFAVKNSRGDFVSLLGMTLFQVDPNRTRNGWGPQSGVPVSMPLKDVFAVYPNPMNRQTEVEYGLKVPGKVSLSVYDLEGRLVQRIVDADQPAGVYHAAWDGRGQDGRTAPAGVYFFRLSMPDKTKTARVVMIH
jgi:hypothetical protein